MSWGAGLVASLLVVLPRPASWIVALASFLVRGGILLFLAPIVVAPSPVGLANILGPTITTYWLGGMSLGFATAVTAIFAAFFGWLVIGGWVAAVTERDLIELVAADDELGAGGALPRPSGSRRRGRIWRIVLLRLAAYVPLALALGYGSLRLVQATYRELTLPSDVVTPIAWRVIATVPEAVIAILVTWALGETLELVDRTGPYALTGAVWARDRGALVEADRVLRHAAGNYYVNDKPTGAVVGQQPFGGARASGTTLVDRQHKDPARHTLSQRNSDWRLDRLNWSRWLRYAGRGVHDLAEARRALLQQI